MLTKHCQDNGKNDETTVIMERLVELPKSFLDSTCQVSNGIVSKFVEIFPCFDEDLNILWMSNASKPVWEILSKYATWKFITGMSNNIP